MLFLTLAKVLLNAVWGWIGEWEITKKALAKVYRKQIESLGAQTKKKSVVLPLSQSYRSHFSMDGIESEDFLVDANSKAVSAIQKEIDCWLDESEEDQSVVVFGDKGVGKTTLLNRLEKSNEALNVVWLSIPPKVVDTQSLCNYLAEKLGFDAQDGLVRGLMEVNRSAEKPMLLLVDDAQNLFLGKVGGFEALKAFVDLVNLNTRKLFWCVVFNQYSWTYLRGVLGQADYFRTEVFLDSWNDDEIKELILSRHKKTEHSLSYDQIILASRSANSHSEAAQYAEEQFFRLLWEQSAGNPRVAVYLWLKCLTVGKGTELRVGLPERPKSERISQLEDATWFVLAAIASHDNLSRKEISDVTNLPLGITSHAAKLALESKLIHKGAGNRYKLGFIYQHDLVRQLKAKNFIYGIN